MLLCSGSNAETYLHIIKFKINTTYSLPNFISRKSFILTIMETRDMPCREALVSWLFQNRNYFFEIDEIKIISNIHTLVKFSYTKMTQSFFRILVEKYYKLVKSWWCQNSQERLDKFYFKGCNKTTKITLVVAK